MGLHQGLRSVGTRYGAGLRCLRSAALVLSLAPLAACDDGASLSFASASSANASRTQEGLRQASFANGAVKLTPPRGYCIDPNSLRRGEGSGFALIARCDMVGVKGVFAARNLALISVTVSTRKGATQPDIAALESAVGDAEILERKPDTDPPMIHLRNARPEIAGASTDQWRAAFAVNGRLVALGLYAPENRKLSGASGPSLLRELTRRTREASQQTTTSTRNDPNATPPALRPVVRPKDLTG